MPRRPDLGHDLSAGLTVALVSVAEGMAYALVAGVDPVYGLYAGSVSVIVGSLICSSSLLVVTATNALALVAADQIGALEGDVDPAQAMFTLTLLIGVVMSLLGLLRLGSLVRFISAEVQAGLVAAVALLIVLGQVNALVGYESDLDGGKVVKAADVTAHLTSWDGPTAAVGAVCIAVLVVTKATRLRSYADIVGMVAGIALVSLLGLDSVQTVGDIASIPTGLDAVPTPHLPNLGLAPELLPAAVAAAIVGLSEAATVGAAYPNPDGSRSDVSRDFVAQGAANVAGGFFQALPAGGSLSRTGVSVSAGAPLAVGRGVRREPPRGPRRRGRRRGGADPDDDSRRDPHRHRRRGAGAGATAHRRGALGLPAARGGRRGDGRGRGGLGADDRHLHRSRPVDAALPGQRRRPGDGALLAASGGRHVGGGGRPRGPADRAGDRARRLRAGVLRQRVPGRPGAARPVSQQRAAVVFELRDRVLYSLTAVDWLRDLVRRLHEGGNVVLLADVEPDQRPVYQRTGLLALVGADNVVWRDPVIGAAADEAVRRADQRLRGGPAGDATGGGTSDQSGQPSD